MKKLFLNLAILLLFAAASFSHMNLTILLGGGGGADRCDTTPPFSDDFSTDQVDGSPQCWTEDDAVWSVSAGVLSNSGAESNAVIRYSTETSTVTQYVKAAVVNYVDQEGLYFRVDGATGCGYVLTYKTTGDDLLWQRFNNDDWAATIETIDAGGAISDGDSLGITVQGTGISTIVSVWDNPTNDAPTDVDNWDSGSDTADFIFTANPATACDAGKYVGVRAQNSASSHDDFFAGDTS
jgi:hypothetical protein